MPGIRVRCLALLCQSVLLVAVVTGCGSQSSVVRKSGTELAAMEARADAARQAVWAGRYDEAITIFEALAAEQHVSQPLYQEELAVAYLAAGREQEAYRALRAAQVSAEFFFDESSEKKAASLWGSESQKVYKGEAHERCSLFLVLGLMMLNRGDTDNALACFKSALLHDADVEQDQYKSDYGLVHMLAAKCYDLRGEPEPRDRHMQAAIRSYASCHPDAQPAVRALYKARNLAEGESISPAAAELWVAYGEPSAGLTTPEGVEAFALAKLEEFADTDYFKPLLQPFNTLIVVWAGTPPNFVRGGRYGETRSVAAGELPIESFELRAEGTGHGCIRGLGSVSYQATTRGGRLMDNVLTGQAQTKGATDDVGDALILAATTTDDAAQALVLLSLGLISKGFSACMTAEADVRAWKTLPHEFQVVPLQLPVGEHDLRMVAYKYATPLCACDVHVTTEVEDGVSVAHVFAFEFGKDALPKAFGLDMKDLCAVQMAQRGYRCLDANGDGEVTPAELDASYARFLRMHDTSQDGKIDQAELAAARSTTSAEFNRGMVKQ